MGREADFPFEEARALELSSRTYSVAHQVGVAASNFANSRTDACHFHPNTPFIRLGCIIYQGNFFRPQLGVSPYNRRLRTSV